MHVQNNLFRKDKYLDLAFFLVFLFCCISMYACYPGEGAFPDHIDTDDAQKSETMGGVTFYESPNEQFGFDGTTLGTSYISLAGDGATAVDVKYVPPSTDPWDEARAQSSSTYDFTVANSDPRLKDNEKTQINLSGANNYSQHISAQLEAHGFVNDPLLPQDVVLNQINVEIYQMLTIYHILFYRVWDPFVTSTEPSTKPTLTDVMNGMNGILKQAVCEIFSIRGSNDEWVNYEDSYYGGNGNGDLDFYNEDLQQSPEVSTIISALQYQIDALTVIYVKARKSNWKLVTAQQGDYSITLESVAGISPNRRYTIGPLQGGGDDIYVWSVDQVTKTIYLSDALGKTYSSAQNTLYEYMPGWAWSVQLPSGPIVRIVFITNYSGQMLRLATHECLHETDFGGLRDVSEDDNIMYWSLPSQSEPMNKLRYRDQTVVSTGTSNPTGEKENQWNAIRGL